MFFVLEFFCVFNFDFCQVLSADGKDEVGKISKQWSGLLKEVFTDTDNFGITCKPALQQWCSFIHK